jgi:hypothetical protein
MTAPSTGPLGVWDRPVRPGLPVSAAPGLVGTLGALARDRGDGAVVVLGTSHVLCPSGSSGAPVWQPSPCGQLDCPCNRVGLASRGRRGVIASGGHRYFLDCAVARLDGDVPWEPTVAGRRIAGVGTARPGTRVWKLGAGSGRTTGVVIDDRHEETARIGGEYRAVPNQLLVHPLPGNPGTTRGDRFSTVGDSGAVVLDDEDRVIGLLWGAGPSGHALACPIEPVLETLGIDLPARG